eukprot:gene24165-9752_t
MKIPNAAFRCAHRPVVRPPGPGTAPSLHAGHRMVAHAALPESMHQHQLQHVAHQKQQVTLRRPNLDRRALLLSVALGSTMWNNSAYARDSLDTLASPASSSSRVADSAMTSEAVMGDVVPLPAWPKSPVPKDDGEILDEIAAKKQLAEEEKEEKKKKRKKSKGRIRELQEIRAELAEKEARLLEKEQALMQKEETLSVLKEQLELERKIRALLTKAKGKAEEEAALAMGLCTGVSLLP